MWELLDPQREIYQTSWIEYTHVNNPLGSWICMAYLSPCPALEASFWQARKLIWSTSTIKLCFNNCKNCIMAPHAFIFFMAGSLPATAVLHICQFCTFGMICRLPDSELYKYALNVLTTAKQQNSSWFVRLWTLCLQYSLRHSLALLKSPPSSFKYKNLVTPRLWTSGKQN